MLQLFVGAIYSPKKMKGSRGYCMDQYNAYLLNAIFVMVPLDVAMMSLFCFMKKIGLYFKFLFVSLFLGVAVILGGDFVIFGKTGGFVDIPKRVPTLGLDKRS